MADQAINALPTKDTPESTDQLLLIGDAEEKIIDYDKLADAILNKLTSKKFEMDTGTQTIMEAIASLNGKSSKYISVYTDASLLISTAIKENRKMILFDAYDVKSFFPNDTNWWSGIIALNDSGEYGFIIAFSFFDSSVYKNIWYGKTSPQGWIKIS